MGEFERNLNQMHESETLSGLRFLTVQCVPDSVNELLALGDGSVEEDRNMILARLKVLPFDPPF